MHDTSIAHHYDWLRVSQLPLLNIPVRTRQSHQLIDQFDLFENHLSWDYQLSLINWKSRFQEVKYKRHNKQRVCITPQPIIKFERFFLAEVWLMGKIKRGITVSLQWSTAFERLMPERRVCLGFQMELMRCLDDTVSMPSAGNEACYNLWKERQPEWFLLEISLTHFGSRSVQ